MLTPNFTATDLNHTKLKYFAIWLHIRGYTLPSFLWLIFYFHDMKVSQKLHRQDLINWPGICVFQRLRAQQKQNYTKNKHFIIIVIIIIIIIIVNPFTARVTGAPQIISQPVSSIFSLFSTALCDLANSRPVHSPMLSSHLFLCLPCLLSPFTVSCKMVLARPDERETWPHHYILHLFTKVRRC